MIKKYVKKLTEVEAIQWTGDNTREIEEFTKNSLIILKNKARAATRNVLLK